MSDIFLPFSFNPTVVKDITNETYTVPAGYFALLSSGNVSGTITIDGDTAIEAPRVERVSITAASTADTSQSYNFTTSGTFFYVVGSTSGNGSTIRRQLRTGTTELRNLDADLGTTSYMVCNNMNIYVQNTLDTGPITVIGYFVPSHPSGSFFQWLKPGTVVIIPSGSIATVAEYPVINQA